MFEPNVQRQKITTQKKLTGWKLITVSRGAHISSPQYIKKHTKNSIYAYSHSLLFPTSSTARRK